MNKKTMINFTGTEFAKELLNDRIRNNWINFFEGKIIPLAKEISNSIKDLNPEDETINRQDVADKILTLKALEQLELLVNDMPIDELRDQANGYPANAWLLEQIIRLLENRYWYIYDRSLDNDFVGNSESVETALLVFYKLRKHALKDAGWNPISPK